MAKDLYNSVVYGSTAANVWGEHKKRFDKRNILRICKLHQEIVALTQGLASVSIYYSKLCDLWGEYGAMVPTPCTCPESKVFLEYL